MSRTRGSVKWFSSEKGWGFIKLESGEEVFVHHSEIQGEGFVSLRPGEPVELSVEQEDRGPRARHVVSLEPSEPRSGAGRDEAGRRSAGRESRQSRSGRDAGRGGESGSRRGRSRDQRGRSAAAGAIGNGTRAAKSEDARHGSEEPLPLAEQIRRRLAERFSFLR